MASAKFLEEALSTDVDESAVSALVGSLETQLVAPAPVSSAQQGATASVNQNHLNSVIPNGGTVASQKHSVTNGGSGSMNILLNSDASKTITTNSLQSGNIVHSNVNTVVASLHCGVPGSGYVNQVTSSGSQPNLAKPHEAVKIVYPACTQPMGGLNVNNRVAFPSGVLPNGNLGLASLPSHTVLNTVSSGVQSVVSHTHAQTVSNISKSVGNVLNVDHGTKQQGTALVIKASGNSNVTQGTPVGAVPMTVNTSASLSGTHTNANVGTTSVTVSTMSGVVTLAKTVSHSVGASQTTIVGSSPTILPANVQIVNVNAVRPGTSVQTGQKALPPRVVIGAPHMVGTRPGQPGQITLQTLQGLQPGTQGHLLLKTENGQYQLLRVGPAPAAPSSTGVVPSNAPGSLPGGTTYRLQSVPAHGAVAVAAATSATTTTAAAITPSQPPTLTSSNAITSQRQAADTTKEKCRKFLANLLELSSREPKSVEKNVRTLIQELIDTKVEPEEFCDRLERLLNASPQPCLIGFLKKSLPLLRQSLVTKELVIDGIRPPPHTVVFSLPNSGIVPQLQSQLRPQAVPSNAAAQVRLMTPVSTQSVGVTTVPRPVQPVQQRLVTPVRAQVPRMVMASALRPPAPTPAPSPAPAPAPSSAVTSSIMTPTSAPARVPAPPLHAIRPPLQVQIRTPNAAVASHMRLPVPAQLKTATATRMTTVAAVAAAQMRPPVPVILPKPVLREKEKKTFSNTGFAGDDDINDVAAMGGVNLAEETQRILGSTEFVGTQIRSCKDEMLLHSNPLQRRIREISSKYGLEDPPNEVAAIISHATQERLKNLVEKLGVIAEHRLDVLKVDPRYEVSQDVKAQLKFLEELDRAERKRHEEQERELLLRAAKSRSKSEDPEQAKLKAKAKEMQRAEMEEVRQREANHTALLAIGPRKKQKLELGSVASNLGQPGSSTNSSSNSFNRTQLPMRPRLKRVNLRDLVMLLEQEKEMCRTPTLFKSYLK
ncbi:transcription initiation factor TFIID subunit 4 isoform X2 [Bacillus rossius redtenbacheri]|uniref:transcription initiation factor TFIID subunit 4 isoform X2 n=1 Tax=Bacillus rossius redtenbacheri TaxID=93214 RepID=UPI002FDE383D